ncbi:MAG: HAD family phosphatase [Mogibacterium sp.]|nr:HAD family phosphatase [Mogibacterium sp.]
MIRLHIFDMDGTLLDSMRMWENVCSEYIRFKGFEPEENLDNIQDEKSFLDAIRYMVDRYQLGSVDEAMQDLERYIKNRYETDLLLFEGIPEYLAEIEQTGIPMVILTNSPHALADPAMRRTGIDRFFRKIYTYEDIKHAKNDPECFRRTCELEGVDPGEVLVHDDADYAQNAAARAGCNVKKYDRYR